MGGNTYHTKGADMRAVKRRTLLVDADIVAFKFASAKQQKFDFDGDGDCAIEPNYEEAIEGVKEYLEDLAVHLQADDIIICLTDPDYEFRKELYPGYKSNRDPSKKPQALMDIKEWFKSHYRTYQKPGLEADDCMGILATHPTLIRGEKIIVSEDKDMQTVPGLHYNPAKDKKPRRIKQLDADRFHLWQTIVGDTCDGYPGAYGVGPKSPEAKAVLAARTVKEAWGHVLAAFERSKLPEGTTAEDQAVLMARLARILRAGDWDFKEQTYRLWKPPV